MTLLVNIIMFAELGLLVELECNGGGIEVQLELVYVITGL